MASPEEKREARKKRLANMTEAERRAERARRFTWQPGDIKVIPPDPDAPPRREGSARARVPEHLQRFISDRDDFVLLPPEEDDA